MSVQDQINEMKVANAVKEALSAYSFRTPGGAEFAFGVIKSKAQVYADGSVIVENLPLGSYLKHFAPAWLDGYLEGSTPGSSAANSPNFDIEKIKPGMSSADKEAARAAINQVAAQIGKS